MTLEHAAPLGIIGAALLVFPALALGLSGFETGVVVMPLVKGDPTDTEESPAGPHPQREEAAHRRPRSIMSVMLIGSSLVTTLLIPAEQFQPGGEANGRALAYLAHELFGDGFGTVYDVVDDRHPVVRGRLGDGGSAQHRAALPPALRHGSGLGPLDPPARARASLIAAIVTLAFDASVDSQAGAYATGVLALMTSAAIAVFLTEWRRGHRRRGCLLRRGERDLRLHLRRDHHRAAGGPDHRVDLHRDHRRHQRVVADQPARPSCACSR